MRRVRNLLITTAALGSLAVLSPTAGAVEPGYGPDSPSRESIEQSRERYGGERGGATGGEVRKEKKDKKEMKDECEKRMKESGGAGTGGVIDSETGTGGASGSGAGGPAGTSGGPDDFGTGLRRSGNGS